MRLSIGFIPPHWYTRIFDKISSIDNKIGWFATFFLMAATSIRAFDISHGWDLFCTAMGCGLWTIDAIRLRSTPLFVVNAFSVMVIIVGLVIS